jgi:hypothetical protein
MMTKDEMMKDYIVKAFAMGLCIVQRRSDGLTGTLEFDAKDGIRYYYNFQEG